MYSKCVLCMVIMGALIRIVSANGFEMSSIVRYAETGYTFEEIKEKINKYQWRRDEFLTFLIILRLQSIEINENFHIPGGVEYPDFKLGLQRAIDKLKRISRNIYERNIWFVQEDKEDEDIKKLVHIQEKIRKYTSTSDIRDILAKNIKPLVEGCTGNDYKNVLSFLCNLTDEERDRAEIEVILGKGEDKHRLLTEVFGISDHYRHVFRHKDLLFLVHFKLFGRLPHVSFMDIICHDWSKFLFELSLGYTWKWTHNKVPNKTTPLVNAWKDVLKAEDVTSFSNGWNQIWKAAWRLHYTSEDHHPEYFASSNSYKCRDANNVVRIVNKEDMNDKGLEESFLDMGSMSLMGILGKDNDLEAINSLKYVEFEVRYLERYNLNDAKKVINKILEISPSSNRESYEEYIKRRLQESEGGICANPVKKDE